MNVNRFVARNTKEALAKVREALGPDAVVLSTREADGMVEILAMPEQDMRRMARDARARTETPTAPREPHPRTDEAAALGALGGAGVQAQGLPQRRPASRREPPPEMSTLSFQKYVLERQQQAELPEPAAPRRAQGPDAGFARSGSHLRVEPELRLEGDTAQPQPSMPWTHGEARAPMHASTQAQASAQSQAAAPGRGAQRAPQGMLARAAGLARDASHAAEAARAPAAPRATHGAGSDDPRDREALMAELRSMRRWIENTFSEMPWSDGVRRSPIQAALIRQMQANGFSERFAREAVRELPSDYGHDEALRWLHLAMTARMQCEPAMSHPLDQGGVFALLGPTGVGKTTTTAKIAARFAMRHGAQSVCLITVDTYRLAAHDQLRAYGRILGVPVHVAHDAATLADFLHLFMNKKLVLIDTMGVSQRDERVGELMASLASPRIGKLLVVSAATQVEVIEDTVRAYRGEQAAGIIVSKTDEAVRLGGVTECLLRHRLKVMGLATGQRVPEDWEYPDPAALVDRALSATEHDEGLAPGSTPAASLQPVSETSLRSAPDSASGFADRLRAAPVRERAHA